MYHSIAMMSMIYDIYIYKNMAWDDASNTYKSKLEPMFLLLNRHNHNDHMDMSLYRSHSMLYMSKFQHYFIFKIDQIVDMETLTAGQFRYVVYPLTNWWSPLETKSTTVHDWFPGWQHEHNRSPHGTIAYLAWGPSFPQKRPSMMDRDGSAPRNEQVFI